MTIHAPFACTSPWSLVLALIPRYYREETLFPGFSEAGPPAGTLSVQGLRSMLTGGHRHGRQPVGSSQQTPFKDGPHTGMKVSERKLAKKERTKGKWKVGRGTGSQRPAILVYGSAILKGSPPMDGIVVDTGYSEAEQSKNKEVIDSIWEEEQTNKEDPLQEREPNQGTSAIKPIRNDEGLKQHSASFEASQQGTTAVFEPADQIPSTGTDTEQISRDPGHIPDAVSAGRKIYKYQCLDGVPPSNESLRCSMLSTSSSRLSYTSHNNHLTDSETENRFANLLPCPQDLSGSKASAQIQHSSQAPIEHTISSKSAHIYCLTKTGRCTKLLQPRPRKRI